MINEKILNMIEKISPQAKDFVSNGFNNNNVKVYYFNDKKASNGTFLSVENEVYTILYAYFFEDSNSVAILKLIKDKIVHHSLNKSSKELCFNVYGRNTKIIDLIRKLDFCLDAEGYHFQYDDDRLLKHDGHPLVEKNYDSLYIKQCTNLFDSAYYQLDRDNGWETNTYSNNEASFNKKICALNRLNQIKTFWIEDHLIGAYTFEENYITDIVVHPSYQNKGYGKTILAKCIQQMNLNIPLKEIRLRVMKNNIGAKRFYEANNFKEIAYFSEHTYSTNKLKD